MSYHLPIISSCLSFTFPTQSLIFDHTNRLLFPSSPPVSLVFSTACRQFYGPFTLPLLYTVYTPHPSPLISMASPMINVAEDIAELNQEFSHKPNAHHPTQEEMARRPSMTSAYHAPDPEKTENLLVPGSAPVASSNASAADIGTALEKAEPQTPTEAPPRTVSGVKWALVVFSILSSTFLFALDNTVVADVQPAIISTFGEIEKLSWLSVAFLLAVASTNLAWGKIYGQFNAKYLYMLTVFLFEAGSAICGAAGRMDTLIVGRAIAGLGGSGMYVGVLTLLSVTTTLQERPMYIGLTGLTWGVGTVLGPVVGGAFADSSATWRWAFYINLVIGGIFAPVYVFLLPSADPRPGVPLMTRAKQIDYLGTVLIVGAFICGIMALSFGGVTYDWGSARIIALFVVSAVLFTAFGIQQVLAIATTKEQRLFPLHFLKRRTLLICFAITAAAGTAIFIPTYFIPLYFQFVRGDSAIDAAVRLLPFIILMVFVVILNGAVLSKYGLYQPWYVVGGAITLAGGALMYTVNTDTSISKVYGYSVLVGIGTGMFIQTSFSVVQAKVTFAEIPLAVGFITCAQTVGVTISLAIANSVFLNSASNQLVAKFPSIDPGTIKGAIAGANSSLFSSLDPASKQEVLRIIISAMSKTYILVITAGAMTLILALFLRRERLFMAAAGAA